MAENIVLPSTGELSRYLRSNGWARDDFPNPNLMVFTSSQKDDAGAPIRLSLPSKPGFADGDRMIVTAVELLAAMASQSFGEMLSAIKRQGADVFEQRIFGPANLSDVPLEFMPKIMQCLRDLVYYSACLEDNAQPYFERRRKVGKEYAKKCRFAHTFPGSFGLRVEMPLPPNPQPGLFGENGKDPVAEPMERRIMKRIYKGLSLAIRGVNEGNVDLLTKNYKTGFNANVCETMETLTSLLPDYGFGYRVAWSSEYKTPEGCASDEISFQAGQCREFFESAAKALRATGESTQTTIGGKIVALHATPEEEEDDDDLAPTFSRQYIEVEWAREGERKIRIRANLSPEDYRKACDAHKDGKTIRLSGIPEKEGKTFMLRNPSDFKVDHEGGR